MRDGSWLSNWRITPVPKIQVTPLPRLEWSDAEKRLFECLTEEEKHEVARRYWIDRDSTSVIIWPTNQAGKY